MLCKNCGKELPIAGKFCPFCGAAVEQTGVNDETAVFTTLPDDMKAPKDPVETGPIDTSAFDAAMRDEKQQLPVDDTAADPLADTNPNIPNPNIPTQAAMRPIDTPPVRRTAGTPERRTTYYNGEADPKDRVYKKPSKGKRGLIIALVVIIVAALIGGGVWYFTNSHKTDENLIMAEKYMDRGNFDKALEYYQKAQAEAKDPAALDATIQLIKDYQSAEDYVGNGQYTEAIAALKQLQNRVTDPDSAMYKAIEDLLDKAQAAQSDDQFNSDLDEAQSYLDDKKYDAASGKLDSLANDDSLTDDQKKQVKELQKQLSDAQQQEKQQEENSQKKAEQRDAFSKKMDELESDDLKISSAENQEDELAMTASSFEQWDNLLSEMYDYLATVLNADQYASEEASYKQWVQERDSGAENAAKETEDDTAKQLASYSFKQSYTKTHCYKLLDLMN